MGSLLDKARPASEVDKLKAMFFGPPGTGKTTLVGTAPKVVVLDVDGGTKSIRDTEADVLAVPDWATFEALVMELMMGGHGYETVGVDSVTLLQELAGNEAKLMDHILAADKDARQAYGAIGAMVRHKLIQLHSLPMNVIFTAHLREREAVDTEAGQYPLVPDVTPAIYKVLVAVPDVIGRTALKQVGATPSDVEYRVVFGPETRSPVKQRDLGLPKEVRGLTIPKLIDTLHKEN